MKDYIRKVSRWWKGLSALRLPRTREKGDYMQYHHRQKPPDQTVSELLNKLGESYRWKE